MSHPIPEYYPPFGLYQSLRYDSQVRLQAVATIAHANVIEYCAKQGIDYDVVTPRPVIGFTFTSQRDSATVDQQLWNDNFDLAGFKEIIDTYPVPESPLCLMDSSTSFGSKPKSLGLVLEQGSVGSLKLEAVAARLAAFEMGGFTLPVRSSFSHISLFYCGESRRRPCLALHQREKLRKIVSQARAEVGIRQVYLGKLIVGADIGIPLSDDALRVPQGASF